MLPGIYHLARKTDQTGVSGTGIVAYVVILPDGACITRWHNTQYKSTVMWDNWQHMKAVHVDCHPDCNELVGPLMFEGEIEEKSFPYEQFVSKQSRNMDGVAQPDSSVCPICGEHCAEIRNAFGNRGKKMSFCLGSYLEPGELRHVVSSWNMFCSFVNAAIKNKVKELIAEDVDKDIKPVYFEDKIVLLLHDLLDYDMEMAEAIAHEYCNEWDDSKHKVLGAPESKKGYCPACQERDDRTECDAKWVYDEEKPCAICNQKECKHLDVDLKQCPFCNTECAKIQNVSGALYSSGVWRLDFCKGSYTMLSKAELIDNWNKIVKITNENNESIKHKFASYLVVAHNFGGGYAEKMVDYIVAHDAGTVNADVGYNKLQDFANKDQSDD